MRVVTTVVMLGSLLCLGCPEEPDPSSEFTGGEFDFLTSAVEENCLDGALEVLFMPEGPETPNSWAYPVYIPSFDEMPMSYSIDLREPFVGIEVTVVPGGENRMIVEDAVMESVLLDEDRYGDCVATMTCDVELLVVDADHLDGTVVISLSDPRGDEERCPVFEEIPCDLILTIEGVRL